jgi:hypothetical protein
MSGKMCSVTGKAYLFWFPAGNLEYWPQNFKTCRPTYVYYRKRRR